MLAFRGSLYFAGAYAVEDKLPSALTAKHAVVIFRLRGRVKIGSTFIEVLERYSAALGKNGGKLMLSGVDAKIFDQLEKTEMIELLGEENIFPDSSKLLYSSKQALKAANAWLGKAGDSDHPRKVKRQRMTLMFTFAGFTQPLTGQTLILFSAPAT